MARGSIILGHIITTQLPLPKGKNADGPLAHREIYFKPNISKETLPAHKTCPVAFMVEAQVDVMNSETEEDDMIVDDTAMDDGNAQNLPTPAPKSKSTITNETSRLGHGSPDNTKKSFRKKKKKKKKPTVNAIATLQRESRNFIIPN
jgi:hypothetical protein